MKPFHLEPGMKTLRGVFYPTGYVVLMFPSERDAREAARRLEDKGFDEEAVSLITPDDFRREIAPATGDDVALPSAGTEGDTVRRFAELARQGHHGLMVHAPSAEESDRVMAVLKDAPISYGQKYRHLVIEDLVV
jgi:Rad3-related DNA helicase